MSGHRNVSDVVGVNGSGSGFRSGSCHPDPGLGLWHCVDGAMCTRTRARTKRATTMMWMWMVLLEVGRADRGRGGDDGSDDGDYDHLSLLTE